MDPSPLNWLWITDDVVEELASFDGDGNIEPAALVTVAEVTTSTRGLAAEVRPHSERRVPALRTIRALMARLSWTRHSASSKEPTTSSSTDAIRR